MVRTTFPLTGKWRFGLDLMNAGEDERWFRTDFGDGSWLLVDIPSSWDYYSERT